MYTRIQSEINKTRKTPRIQGEDGICMKAMNGNDGEKAWQVRVVYSYFQNVESFDIVAPSRRAIMVKVDPFLLLNQSRGNR